MAVDSLPSVSIFCTVSRPVVNVEQMRAEVTKVYSGSDSWAFKVRKMTDNQVIAIYRRFQRDGKI